MRSWMLISLLLLAAAGGQAEIIDRVAVTVDRMVITQSDIVNHIRVAAFLNQEPVNFGSAKMRSAAERMVEQVLVRREMEISRYPAPAPEEAEQVLAEIRDARSLGEEEYQRALEEYGITAADLRESILLQLTLLRFIEFRFRPGVALTDEEVEKYYQTEFIPEWSKRNPAPPPDLDDVRDDIESLLTQRQVDAALDNWLEQAAAQARIEYREEAFQ